MKNMWFIWMDIARSPFLNMAIDEILIDKVVQSLDKPILRFYDWNTPSISIGYSQTFPKSDDKHAVVRRFTGGGVVFHDSDITYSVAVPQTHPICHLNRHDSYKFFHIAIMDFFSSFGVRSELSPESSVCENRKVMRCFVSPSKYDIISENTKLAGAAQRRGRKGILHQGSIILPEKINLSKETLINKIKNSFEKIHSIIFQEFKPDEVILNEARLLEQNKYSTSSWNQKAEIS